MLTGALVLALAVLLGVLSTFILRGSPVRTVRTLGHDDARETRHAELAASAQALSKMSLRAGHALEILANGDETFPRLLEALRGAREHVTWHVFWFKPGRLADEVSEVLRAQASRGIRVLALFDHYGSKGLGRDYLQRLRAAGVDVAVFREPRWNTLYKAQQRTHARSVVIDGTIGFTGGFGIDDRWTGDGRSAGHWRDTNVRIEGPAVTQLQGAFAASWAEATGELLLGTSVFRGADAGDGADAGLLYSSPSFGSTSAERFFAASLNEARDRIRLATAYFVPGRYFRGALCAAAARGVDVRILTPGANTDRMSTWHAARGMYDELLAGGVRLYEYRPTMMHAKTLVVDRIWCAVGTLNFDNRSMVLNDEVALVVRDEAFGDRLDGMFMDDLARADEVTLDAHRARGRRARLAESTAHLIRRLL